MHSRVLLATLLLVIGWQTAKAETQHCRETIPASTPRQHFIPQSGGTLLNRRDGLRWMRCAIGQQYSQGRCLGQATLMSLAEARQVAKRYEVAGVRHWRLPSLLELSRIVELRCDNPAINMHLFPDTPSVSFWVDTDFVNRPQYHWLIQFRSGGNHIDKLNAQAAVRLVHDPIEQAAVSD